MAVKTKAKRTPTAPVPEASEFARLVEAEREVIHRPFDPLPLPPLVGRGEYGGEAVVTIRQADWEVFLDLVEDIRALQRFELIQREPPEAFIETAELKRQMLKNRIREVRKAKGLTQAALAKTMKRHTSFIGKIEQPDYRPRMATLKRVAKALGCEVVDLI